MQTFDVPNLVPVLDLPLIDVDVLNKPQEGGRSNSSSIAYSLISFI